MTDELYHYGVLEMKCGVKRNPGAAYTKATSKASRLVNQYINKSSRANSYNENARSRERRYITEIGRGVTERQIKKAVKLDHKAEKARKKAANWNKKISKAFKNADVSKIDNSVVDAGRKTVNEFNKTVLNTNDPKISKGRELMRNVI